MWLVCLTDKGRSMVPVAVAAMQAIEEEWGAAFGQEDVETLRSILRRLHVPAHPTIIVRLGDDGSIGMRQRDRQRPPRSA